MATPKVFFVHLRRPGPDDQRDDPFYEFGSFGCTKCHSRNLLHPDHASALEGARLAFIQGGPLGSRLVFLTPPITVEPWSDCCEAKWAPGEMPFKYCKAPLLVSNNGGSDFKLVKKFARNTRWGTERAECGLSSCFRSRTHELDEQMAKEVITVYEKHRRKARDSDIALTYDEALPYTTKIDRTRKATFRERIRELTSQTSTRCRASRPRPLNHRKKGCT